MSFVYVGCRSTVERNARGKGLKTYRIEENGDWTELQCLKVEENPSYQTLDHEGKFLYSVHGDLTKVSSYQIQEDGTLRHLNTLDIGGKNPVFITLDKTNRYLLVAALQGGSVYTIRRRADGSLGEIVSTERIPGKKQSDVSFAHQCIWDKTGEYLFVVTQGRRVGYGLVLCYRFDTATGKLTLCDRYQAYEYDEPRHLAVHPNNRWLYLINEKGNKMTWFAFDPATGKLQPRQWLPTLPAAYCGEGQASAAVLSQNGKILIGSNRIHESIVLYRVDEQNGAMQLLGWLPALGKTPRFITFTPDYRKFYLANEDSDTIVELVLDEETGKMEYTGRIVPTESPVCLTFKQ